ncbi:MAG: DUF1631 domain-containing protein [Gammaproteobacteria bacterium]|nr:DUF1631 domain-containing protein [Gammaproteobacteria bacterium]
MARDNVVSFDQNLGGGRRRVADARTHELVSRCRRHLADTLPRLMQELFEHVDDELYQLADKSASDVLQTRYFDAMRELRKLRDAIDQAFLNGHLETFDKFWLHPQVTGGETDAEAAVDDELSLVDNDELEENLAVSGMVSKAENRYHRELFALNMRFAQMVGIPDLTTRQNPVGPYVMADGFRDAMRQWAGELGVRLVVFKLFDRYVMGYVGGLYDELNDTLVEAGVLPKIVQRVRRNPVAPSVQRARQEGAPSEPPPSVDVGGAATIADEVSQEQILGLLGQLLSVRRGHGAANLHSSYLPGGPGAEYAHLPVVASNELLNALHGLQREASVEAPVSRAEIEQLQGEMLVNLGRQLEMGSADAPAKRLQQVDQDLIDVVGMLFEFILDDSNVPEAMKALLGRLQIPMLKVAVIDRSFFSNKQHPARRLLNALAKAGMAWVDDGDRSAKSLYGRIETIVTRILGEFSDDVGLFAQLYDEFANFVEREARGAEVAEERINQVTRGQEQLLIARRRVAEVLNDFRVANPDLPTAVVNILREGWHDVMLLAYLREGEESVAWKHAFDAVEELIWSVQPKIEQPERQKLLKAIPDLLKKLRDGLNNISFDQHRAGQLFKDLQTCHIAALRGESDAGDSSLLEEVIPDSVLRGIDDEQEVIEDAHTDTARAMVVGKWIEWRGSDDSWVRGKLSWRSEVTSNCIFVNRKGMKVAEMTLLELAALFRDGRARVLDDLNTPLMDRALSAMLGALKDTGGDTQPA